MVKIPLINVYGIMGSGKTLLTTIIAYLNQDNLKIVSNYTLKNIKYEKFSKLKYIKAEYKDCIILLDEGYVYLDSRSSMENQNKLMSYALFQSRKKSVFLFITIQLLYSLDVRYRDLAEYCIACEEKGSYFSYELFRPQNPFNRSRKILPLKNAIDFFQYYDTNEIISINHDTFEFYSEVEREERVKQLAKTILADYKANYYLKHPTNDLSKIPKIQKYYVDDFIQTRKLDKKFSKLVFDRIRKQML